MEPVWLSLARREIGVHEIPGSQAHTRIVEYFRLAGSPHIASDEIAWCSAFACAVMELCRYQSPRTLWARNWAKWGVPSQYRLGAVIVLTRGDGGHVGFYLRHSQDGKFILLLGGNQANQVKESWFPIERVIAVRWPAEKALFNAHPTHTETAPDPEEITDDAPTVEMPAVVRQMPPPTPPPRVPVATVQTRDDAEAYLRTAGSRTIEAADASETKSKLIVATGSAGIVGSIMTAFTDVYQSIGPLGFAFGAGTIAIVCLVVGAAIVFEQRRIKSVRAEDHITGRHRGR